MKHRTHNPISPSPDVVIKITLGIGDVVSLEPGIRLCLNDRYTTVHLFVRTDARNLYHNYDGVVTYPLEAHSKMIDLLQQGAVHVTIDNTVHRRFDPRNRIDAFADVITNRAGVAYDFTDPLVPLLPVADEYLQWAEVIQSDPGIQFGISCIDKLVIPMRPGDLVSIIARPGHGKTSLMEIGRASCRERV